jgi:hypothetical protein
VDELTVIKKMNYWVAQKVVFVIASPESSHQKPGNCGITYELSEEQQEIVELAGLSSPAIPDEGEVFGTKVCWRLHGHVHI